MQLASPALFIPATVQDAVTIHQLYTGTPDYFRIISIPMPTLEEVERDLEIARQDPRRHVELLLADEQFKGIAHPKGNVVGYLDYKLDYPKNGEAMVNLLMILGQVQSSGLGRQAVKDLEAQLKGRVKRVLVSIYGQNHRAERFWKSQGYSFAIDAKPILDWYGKLL
jgi:ribosomal protein S18 acetylase RimI-like enzyme